MATYDFYGEVRTPCSLCLRPYQSFKQFEFTFYLFIFFFAGPGQFTKRLLIISADAKGKDSMILLKIKETAHINSGHVLFESLGSHVMMALTGGGGGAGGGAGGEGEWRGGVEGGGGVKARRPEYSLDNVFLVINLFYSLQSGSNGFITEGRRGSNFFQGVGVSKETHITCDFPGGGGGGPDPLPPSGSSQDRNMIYQN